MYRRSSTDKVSVFLIFLCILSAIFLIILFATNPTLNDYNTWLDQQVNSQVGTGGSIIWSIFSPLAVETQYKSYGIFTIFQTKLKFDDKDEPMKVFGIFNRFIIINQSGNNSV